jgi:type II secretory pathway predicted ATPase ExeA
MTRHQPVKITPNDFFGFKRHPFIDHPEFAEPVFSPHEDRLFEMASELVRLGKSFVITGTPGTGKTTLARHLRDSLDKRSYHPVFIPYSGLNRGGLLKALGAACRLDMSKRTVPPLLKIQRHLLEMAQDKNPRFPVLFIDDAQLLEQESLLDLCSLIADPDQKRAATTLVLVGDETLEGRLLLNVMTPVWNRMACNLATQPLTEPDALTFIQRHLERANAPNDLIAPEAVTMLAVKTRGNRRDLLNAATVLLTEAMIRSEKTVGPQLVLSSLFWKKSG